VVEGVDIEAARTRLNAERERVSEERQRLYADASRALDEPANDGGANSHLADNASDTYERELDVSLEDNADHLLAAIDAALGRVDAGTYGSCERCGKPIDPERLEALPWATKCIECKRLEERG
jgi:DnaK suppressor protein